MMSCRRCSCTSLATPDVPDALNFVHAGSEPTLHRCTAADKGRSALHSSRAFAAGCSTSFAVGDPCTQECGCGKCCGCGRSRSWTHSRLLWVLVSACRFQASMISDNPHYSGWLTAPQAPISVLWLLTLLQASAKWRLFWRLQARACFDNGTPLAKWMPRTTLSYGAIAKATKRVR